MKKKDIVVGLEVGRHKISMVAVDLADNKRFDLLFASKVYCADGMKNGAIVNLDSVTEAIIKLLEEAKQKTQKTFNSAFVNISGLNVKQEIVNSVITLPQRGCEITERHIDDLIESCKIVSVPMDSYLLYLLPLGYAIDGQDGVKEPIGLCGTRLEAKMLIVTAPFNQVQNIKKAINFAGAEIEEIVPTALANSYSMLIDEDRKGGVLLIDLKTDVTEIAIIKGDSLLFFTTIPKGQEDITNEIAVRLNIPLELAEELKIRYGFLDNDQQDARNQDIIPIEWMRNRQAITRGELNKIITERFKLIFDLIYEEIKGFKGFNNIVKSGVVISGGCVYMEGVMEWAAQSLGFTVRQAVLGQDFAHLDYSYLTAVGLLKYGLRKRDETNVRGEKAFFKKVFQKTGELLSDYF